MPIQNNKISVITLTDQISQIPHNIMRHIKENRYTHSGTCFGTEWEWDYDPLRSTYFWNNKDFVLTYVLTYYCVPRWGRDINNRRCSPRDRPKMGIKPQTPDPIPTWNRVHNSKKSSCPEARNDGDRYSDKHNVLVSTELLLSASFQPIGIEISQ